MIDRLKIHSIKPVGGEIQKADICETSRFGLYIVQSEFRKVLFRIGATGVNDKGTLRGRIFTTYRGKRRPENWTTCNLKWRPLWMAEIKDGTPRNTAVAEYLLFAHFGSLYPFVHNSCFYATVDVAVIVAHAQSLKAKLEEVINFQITKTYALPPADEWPTHMADPG